MNKFEQDFIREYCEKYGVKMSPGPGAPCLNGASLTGPMIRSLFSENGVFLPTVVYSTDITFKRGARGNTFSCDGDAIVARFLSSFYQGDCGGGWNAPIKEDKLAPAC